MRRRSGTIAAMALGALFVSGGALSAGAVEDPLAVDQWSVPQTSQAGTYWTPERMRAASPGDALVSDNLPVDAIGAASPGTLSVPSQSADPGVTPFATAKNPIDHVGKVFFTLGGTDYVCSGNPVASANENTVATAGHCLNEGPGDFASDFVFVPGYENGSAPFGHWVASDLVAPSQWTSQGDITYDTGFAVVTPPSGASLTDTVGASGVAFNESRGQAYTACGYPAAAPFDGETLQSCLGTATPDPFGQSESQGVPCDMTGGSSGGPWFIGGGSTGRQNSVNSFGYTAVSDTMFGPFWVRSFRALTSRRRHERDGCRGLRSRDRRGRAHPSHPGLRRVGCGER